MVKKFSKNMKYTQAELAEMLQKTLDTDDIGEKCDIMDAFLKKAEENKKV